MNEIYIAPTSELKVLSDLNRHREIEGHLTAAVNKLWPAECHKALSRRLSSLDKTGTITISKAARCWDKSLQTSLIDKSTKIQTALIFNYISATVYNSRIKIFSDHPENSDLFIYAAYHLGALEWHIEAIEAQIKITKKAEQGGKAKSSETDTIRAEIIILLLNPPRNGWPSKEKTAELLRPTIEQHISESGLDRYVEDSFGFICRELSKGATKQIYMRHKEKK